MKKLIPYISLIVISSILFFLTIRGSWGIPTVEEITPIVAYISGTPFESSQEGSRYAMVLSLFHDHSVVIDKYFKLGLPDIGKIQGHYYSLFPFGASVFALPFYFIGLKLGATQIFTFLVSTVFSLFTMLMIVKYLRKLSLHWSIALFSAIAFGFGTNAWGYSVTFVAHLISAFFILSALYIVSFIKEEDSFFKVILFWVFYSIAVYVDFPNLFIFLPMALALAFKTFKFKKLTDKTKITFNFRYALSPFVFILLMMLYGYYNYTNFGKATILSNTLPRIKSLDQIAKFDEEEKDFSRDKSSKNDSVSALETRNTLTGFESFLINPDRGVLIYSPVILLFVFGVPFLKKKKNIKVLLISVPLTCLVLYTMFGDPYGGWAFGSRYMIAIMPELCILAGIGLAGFTQEKRIKKIPLKILYSLVFIYSTAISLMAPLTTNVIPPKVEAVPLGLDYTYAVNFQMLENNNLNSFFFNHIINKSISGLDYYAIVLAIVYVVGLSLIWYPVKEETKK